MPTALMFLVLTIIILSFVIVNNVIFEEKDVVALNNTLIQPLSKPLSNNSLCTVPGPCTATTTTATTTNLMPNSPIVSKDNPPIPITNILSNTATKPLNNTLIQPLSKPLSNNSLCTVPGPCTATTIPTAINSNSNGTFAKTLSNTTPNIISFHNPTYPVMNLSNNYNSPFPNTNSGLQALYIKQQNELLALVQKQQQEQTNFLQNQLQHLFGNTFSQQQQPPPFNSTLSTPATVLKNSNLNTINPIQR